MRRSTIIAMISLLVSIVGVLIALAAYFKDHGFCHHPYDEDDDFFDEDFYEDDCECGDKCTDINEFQNPDIDFASQPPKDEEQL